MASRRNRGSFAEDIGYSGRAATPDASGLASAIVNEGRVKGETSASLLKLAGEGALDAYEGKLKADVAKAAHDALSQLDTGYWVGQKASGYINEVADEAENTVFKEQPVPKDKEVRDFEERMVAIAAGADQRIISQEVARARVSAALKQAIAAMPGRADSFRSVAREITGSGDWHIMEAHNALTGKTRYQVEAEERAKLQQKLLDDNIKWLEKNYNLAPSVGANMLENDPGLLSRLSSTTLISAQLARAADDATNRITTLEKGSREVYEASLVATTTVATQHQIGAFKLLNAELATSGISLESLRNPDGTLDFNKTRETSIQLAAAQEKTISYLTQNKMQALERINTGVFKVTGSDAVKLREAVTKQYDDAIEMFRSNPGTAFAMFDALQKGNTSFNNNMINQLSMLTSFTDAVGGQAMLSAYMANPETFKVNHPRLASIYEGMVSGATGLFDAAGLASIAQEEKVLRDEDDVNVPSNPANEAARINVSNVAVQTIKTYANNTDPLPASLPSAMVQLVAEASVRPKVAEDLARLTATGDMDKIIGRMNADDKYRLASAIQESFNKRILAGEFKTPLYNIREHFKGGIETDGFSLTLRAEEDSDRSSTLTFDPSTGGFSVRFSGFFSPAQKNSFEQIRRTIRNNAQLITKLGVMDEKQAVQDMVTSVFNTLSTGQAEVLNVLQAKPTTTPTPMIRKEGTPEEFDMSTYLIGLKGVESSGGKQLDNEKSSAAGPFQFTKATWEEVTSKMGVDWTMEDRYDEEKSRQAAQYYAEQSFDRYKKILGRTPQYHELYLGHFLGPTGGRRFLTAPTDDEAIKHVGERQAADNKDIFYKKDGKPRTVNEVLSIFKEKFNKWTTAS